MNEEASSDSITEAKTNDEDKKLDQNNKDKSKKNESKDRNERRMNRKNKGRKWNKNNSVSEEPKNKTRKGKGKWRRIAYKNKICFIKRNKKNNRSDVGKGIWSKQNNSVAVGEVTSSNSEFNKKNWIKNWLNENKNKDKKDKKKKCKSSTENEDSD